MPRKSHIPIGHAHPHPAYARMVAKCNELSLPVSFTSDVTKHDRQALLRYDPKEPFAWFLGKQGTHIARRVSPGALQKERQGIVAVLEFCKREGWIPFLWNGHDLRIASDDELTLALLDWEAYGRWVAEATPRNQT